MQLAQPASHIIYTTVMNWSLEWLLFACQWCRYLDRLLHRTTLVDRLQQHMSDIQDVQTVTMQLPSCAQVPCCCSAVQPPASASVVQELWCHHLKGVEHAVAPCYIPGCSKCVAQPAVLQCLSQCSVLYDAPTHCDGSCGICVMHDSDDHRDNAYVIRVCC